jgi:hypothetical protein
MTDRTNAPYDPEAAETSQEWAARVGQEHDTWHRPDSGGGDTPLGSATGTLSASANYISLRGPLVGALPAVDSVSALTINGTDLGRHQLADAIPTYDGYWTYGNGYPDLFEVRAKNLDGVDNQAIYDSLNGQTVTVEWT